MMESHIGPSTGAVRGSSSASSSTELIVQSPQRPRVAIPRLPQLSGDDGSGSPAGCGDKHRVSHACEPCRQRKTKCSGERPTCKHCNTYKLLCCYAGGKRDRAKNEMILLKAKVELYGNLLKQLKNQVDSAGQLAIQKALQGANEIDYCEPGTNRDGESLVTAEVGSTGSLDHIREEPNRSGSTYPTGYMGKNSEVAWIQRVAQQLAREASVEPARAPLPLEPGSQRSHSEASGLSANGYNGDSATARAVKNDEDYQFETPTYHLDDLSVSIAGGLINPFYLPPKETADELLNAFFTTVYPTFPIVLKKLFMAQYDAFFQSFYPPTSSKRWLAMLNLMFAIGSMYGRLINADWKEESEIEHLKYFSRARVLSLDEGSILEVPDLQQVQVVGLAAIYLIASNQTNRAWNVIGLAIRYAQTLGLNLRNDVPEFDEAEKEMRVRMWYTLYSLEYLLCIMTGRPSCIHDKDCSVPMPRPVNEDRSEDGFDAELRRYSGTASLSSNLSSVSSSFAFRGSPSTPQQMSSSQPSTVSSASSPSTSKPAALSSRASTSVPFVASSAYPSTYFVEHTKLNQITAEILSELYSPATRNKSWSDVQGVISAMELKVMKWRADLPHWLDFNKRQGDQVYYRQRMNLAFQYHYIRIIINRPCLCRLNYRIPNESNRSRGFNRSAAATCIGAARETIALLPDEPNPVGLINSSPWWCLLHYLVSAGAILMVEMAMRAEHNPQQADGLLKDSKKVLRWLRAMAVDSLGAERSCKVLTRLLVISSSKIGGDISDVQLDFPEDCDVPGGIKAGNVGNAGTSNDFLHRPSQPASSTHPNPVNDERPAEDLHDIFRGFWTDPFIPPIHTHFDDNIAMQDISHLSSPTTDGHSFPPQQDHNNGPGILQNLQPLQPQSGMIFGNSGPMDGISVDSRQIGNINVNNTLNAPGSAEVQQERRMWRRESQGIIRITLPPPYPTNWASVPAGGVGYPLPSSSFCDSAQLGGSNFDGLSLSTGGTMGRTSSN